MKRITLKVHEREVVAILGSNGAGKTTLLKTVQGLLSPREGRILFEDSLISGRPPHEIIPMGIASVPEERELFGPMSVIDNLLLGTYSLTSAKRKEIMKDRLDMWFPPSASAVLLRMGKRLKTSWQADLSCFLLQDVGVGP